MTSSSIRLHNYTDSTMGYLEESYAMHIIRLLVTSRALLQLVFEHPTSVLFTTSTFVTASNNGTQPEQSSQTFATIHITSEHSLLYWFRDMVHLEEFAAGWGTRN